jgi:hypothetical protein
LQTVQDGLTAAQTGRQEDYDKFNQEVHDLNSYASKGTMSALKDELKQQLRIKHLAGEKILELIETVKNLKELPLKPVAKKAWWKMVALATGAVAVVIVVINRGGNFGDQAVRSGQRLETLGDAFRTKHAFERQIAQYEHDLKSIKLPLDQFETVARSIVQPVGRQPMPTRPANIPQRVAIQPMKVSVIQSDQTTQTADITVGGFLSQLPSGEREHVEETLRNEIQYEDEHHHIGEHAIHVSAVDGSGSVFGRFNY